MALPEGGYQWQCEAARIANTGLRFWVYVTTVPLTLLTLANAKPMSLFYKTPALTPLYTKTPAE